MKYVTSFENVDFDFINSKLKNGTKFRIDIGTSICSPVTKFWFDNIDENIFVIGIDPNPDCYEGQNIWNSKITNIKSAFEGHPKSDNYYHLCCAIDNVEKPEKCDFYRTTVNVGCSSLLKPKLENFIGCQLQDIIKVDTISMKYLLDKIEYDKIEMVKIDAQGKDLDIVKSFKEHLKNVVYLDVEGDTTRQYENAPNNSQIINQILALDFVYYANLGENLRFVNSSLDTLGYNNKTGDL